MWDVLIINPMLNSLLYLYQLLFNNFTLAITVFTILVRVLTYPLIYQQQKSAKALNELQQSEAWKKVQAKYAKDKEKLAQEQMKMYQQAGVSPLSGCLPTLIQFPILIGLYQAISLALADSPVQVLNLSRRIYPFLPNVAGLVPLNNTFLWLNLVKPDPYFVLPVLVAITTWLQSRVMTPPNASADPQAAQMTQSMAILMPLMFGYFSLQFSSGLSIYFIISNVIGIVQYALTTPVDWKRVFSFSLRPSSSAISDAANKKNT